MLSKIYRHSFIYLGSSMIARGIPFIILPYITRVISPEQVGNAAMFMLILGFFIAVVGSNTQQLVSKYIFAKDETEVSFSEILTSGITYNLILLGISILTLCIISNFKEIIFGISIDYIMIIPMLAFLNVFFQMKITLLRYKSQPFRYAIYEISKAIIQGSIIYLYICFIGKSWHYQFYSQSIPIFLLGVFSYINLKLFKLSIKRLNEVIKHCFPQILYLVSGMVIFAGDRFMLHYYSDNSELGIYTVSYTIALILGVLVESYLKSYSPSQFKNLNSSEISKADLLLYKSLLGLFFLTIVFVVISFTAYPFLLGLSYQEGRIPFVIISCGIYFQSVYKLLFPFLFNAGFSKKISIYNLFGAILNIFLNILLIPKYGITGCAYATLITFFTISLLSVNLKNKALSYKRG